MKRTANTWDCDVLVIGGGLAGTWAALKAKEMTDNVLLVEKGKVSKSGASTFAAGVMLAPQLGDDFDVWMKEIVEKGNYINDQDWVDVVLNEQPNVIDDLQTWGVEFEKDEKGKLIRITGRGHINTRVLMFHGTQFMQLMKKQVEKKGVKLVERVMITDLLTSDGRHPTKGQVIGAVGFNARDGEFHIFKAKSVVLASGGVWGDCMCVRNLMGDGIGIGFRAGAEVYGMEFAYPSEGWVFDRKYKVQGMNMWQHAGMYLVNNRGERFMTQYPSLAVLKERAQKAELHLALARECLAGRGPIQVDMRHFEPGVWDLFRRVIQNFMRVAQVLEPWQKKITFDFGAGALNACASGIKNNTFCETNLPGLFVAGQVSGLPGHGTHTVGGFNLAGACVSGRRAGTYAARYSRLIGKKPEIHRGQLDHLESSAFAPLSVSKGLTPTEFSVHIKEGTGVAEALFRSEKGISAILDNVADLKAVLSKLAASDYHGLVRANELKNYLTCLELIYRTALERTESRGPHMRIDYPYRDDINWLKRIVVRAQENEAISIELEPVPIYRYGAKPEAFERIPSVIAPPSF